MATIQWGAGAVARKSTQNGKITQPAAGGRNLGRREPIAKAARYGDHHCPAAVADEPYIYPENFNVVLERTVRELNGESCISLEEAPPPKQQIVCSRSFGQRITTYEEMRRAVCQYAERAAEKLRGERQYCRHISTFIKTSPFAVNEPYYGNVATEKLNTPTRDTRDIIAAAVRSLDRIWLDGHRYAKAGIMLNDFSPNGVAQLNLFDDVQPRPHSDALMKVLDGINHSGLGKVWFAGRGIAPDWQMKREMLSPAYTTRWKELPVARF